MTVQQDPIARRLIRVLVPKPIRAVYWNRVEQNHLRLMRAGENHERQVCSVLKRQILPGMVCVDVGANVGQMSVLMCEQAGPTGKVFSFEPSPANVAAIQKYIDRCGFNERSTIVEAAVNDGSCDSVDLFAGRDESHSEWNITGVDATGKACEQPKMRVKAVSLDKYFDADQRIDVVKMDVEGAEWLVLAGMKRVLKQWRPTLLIECHSPENWRAVAKLTDLGYSLVDMQGGDLDPQAEYPASHILATAPANQARKSA